MARRCIVCNHPDVTEVVEHNRRYFFCSHCNKLHERAIDTDFGSNIEIQTPAGIKHVIVGALITQEDQILLLKRRAYPYGYAFPAGHVEYEEKPLATLVREVNEETGLIVKNPKLIFEGDIDNKCRYGANIHLWYFYYCEFEAGVPIFNAESEAIGWYTLKEIEKMDLIYSAKQLIKLAVKPFYESSQS
jgi:8-oxo-dGTP pyrophosphatase MutT (NUDIX family)